MGNVAHQRIEGGGKVGALGQEQGHFTVSDMSAPQPIHTPSEGRILDHHAQQREGNVGFDTELIITKVWFLHKYGQCPDFVERALRDYPMDIYLLCYPDMPWQPDPVRENPDIREYLFDWYEREIQELGIPYYIIRHE